MAPPRWILQSLPWFGLCKTRSLCLSTFVSACGPLFCLPPVSFQALRVLVPRTPLGGLDAPNLFLHLFVSGTQSLGPASARRLSPTVSRLVAFGQGPGRFELGWGAEPQPSPHPELGFVSPAPAPRPARPPARRVAVALCLPRSLPLHPRALSPLSRAGSRAAPRQLDEPGRPAANAAGHRWSGPRGRRAHGSSGS